MYTDDHFSVVFSGLIQASYDFRRITLEIKEMLIENKFVDETTTYKSLVNNKQLVENLKRLLALGLSDKILESKYGNPYVDDFSLYHDLINMQDIKTYCQEKGKVAFFLINSIFLTLQ